MALLTKQTINRTGPTPTYTGVASTDTFVPGQYTFLHFKNTGGGGDNVTIPVLAGNPVGLSISSVAVTVPATTGDKMIGPFNPQFFADPTTGLATINNSATTGVTVAVLDLSQP